MVSFYILSIILFSLSAPLLLSIMMILICLFMGLNSFIIFSDPWCSLIFLMIFFGGLLVLFVYISTLATNENMNMNFMIVLFLSPLIVNNFMNWEFSFSNFWIKSVPQAVYLFNLNYYTMSIGLMVYLLLALFVVSHITFFHYGALRDVSVSTYKKITPNL